MKLQTKADIVSIIQSDALDIIHTVEKLNLPDWWIGAGFVRSKVWDYLHGHTKRTELADIDVIYFDTAEENPEEKEMKVKNYLEKKNPRIVWQVKNQAIMHIFHKDKPYKNAEEALSRWVETATCIGVRINQEGKLVLALPLGVYDLIYLFVRPNPTIPFDKKTL